MLRARGLGGLLTGVPALRGLRRAFDRHWLVLAAPPALAPLAVLTGAVDEVLPYAAPGAGEWLPLRWPGGPPDLAVNLHGRGPHGHRVLVDLRPRRVWGFAHASFPQVGGPGWVDAEHEVARWCGLLAHHRVPADPADLGLPWPAGRVSPRPGAVVVHPGAGHPSRRWPADRFAAVVAALYRVGYPVVISGSVAERALAVDIAEAAGLSRDDVLAGRTDPLDLAALVATARLVICGDTGVGHLATAYGTPSVLVFGSRPPSRCGPPPAWRQHAALWHPTDPMDSVDARPDNPAPALLAISVPDVLDAAATVLDAGTAPAAEVWAPEPRAPEVGRAEPMAPEPGAAEATRRSERAPASP